MVAKTRAEWLIERGRGLGASDAAAAAGISRWKSNVTLWEEKTGRREPDDISSEEAVQRGIREEPGIRAMFAAMHPEFRVFYEQFDVVRNAAEPWYLATLDGRLYESDLADGAPPYGVLEIKTTEIKGRAGWAEWDGRVPVQYLAQVLHQLHATGADFAILAAFIHSDNPATGRRGEWREYRFDSTDYADQIAWLVERERDFWRHVETDTEPPMILPGI